MHECSFTPGAAVYASTLARRLLIRFLPALLAVICIPAVWAFFDIRMLYLCLMLIFIIYPMIMSMAWIAVVAKPHVAMCARPQSWRFDGDYVAVSFLAYDGETVVKCLRFEWKDVDVEFSAKRYIIDRRNAGDDIATLILPADLVPDNISIKLSDG